MQISNNYKCNCGSKRFSYGNETIELPDTETVYEFGEDLTKIYQCYPVMCLECGMISLFSKKFIDGVKG
jgi:hypothetical protein